MRKTSEWRQSYISQYSSIRGGGAARSQVTTPQEMLDDRFLALGGTGLILQGFATPTTTLGAADHLIHVSPKSAFRDASCAGNWLSCVSAHADELRGQGLDAQEQGHAVLTSECRVFPMDSY